MKKGRKLSKFFVYLLLIFFGTLYIFPFFVLITTSFKTLPECFVYPIKLFPKKLRIENYLQINDYMNFMQSLKNTLIVAIFNVIGVLLSCPLVAYSLARIRWRGRELLFMATLGVMMIPYQVLMIPVYLIFAKLNMVGTFLPLIIPHYFGVPFFIFLLRQFFKGLPKDLEDAARIDGCSEFKIYWRIMLPLVRPALLTIGLFQLLNSWNDFNGPLIYLQEESMYTLQLALQQFKSTSLTAWPQLMAASFLVCLPIIIIFFIAQRYFMEGITFSGIRG